MRCCCQSEQVSGSNSSYLSCSLAEAGGWFSGCRTLMGRGFHSWNNMPRKYENLENYGKCVTLHPADPPKCIDSNGDKKGAWWDEKLKLATCADYEETNTWAC